MRRKFDRYETSSALVYPLLEHMPKHILIFEPCCGNGLISNYLKDQGYRVITNDIDPDVEADFHLDMSLEDSWKEVEKYYDLDTAIIITNPPYKNDVCIKIIENSFKNVRGVMHFFLLRLSFLEPTKLRQKFLINNPPDYMLVTPRFSFTGDGKTDSVTTAWFCWHYNDEPKGIEVMERID